VRLRAIIPALSREGLTPERLAAGVPRGRIEIALMRCLNDALQRIAPRPWRDRGRLQWMRPRSPGCRKKSACGSSARSSTWTERGPVELAKLEALCSSLQGPIHDASLTPRGPAVSPHPRGAMITLSGAILTVERAPPRVPAPKRAIRPQEAIHQAGRLTHIRPIPLAEGCAEPTLWSVAAIRESRHRRLTDHNVGWRTLLPRELAEYASIYAALGEWPLGPDLRALAPVRRGGARSTVSIAPKA